MPRDRGIKALTSLAALLAGVFLALATVADAVSPDPSPMSTASGRAEKTLASPFEPNIRVNSGSTGYDHQVEPTLVVDNASRLYVGWKEALTHNGPGQRVAFATSGDGGASFTPNVLMDLTVADRQSDPWLSLAPNGTVYFTRLEFSGTNNTSGISVSASADGLAWGPTHFLEDTPNFADKEIQAVGADGTLYLVFNSDDVAGGQDLVFVRSPDGGATWTRKARVPDALGGVIGGNIGVLPSGDLLVAWFNYTEQNIYVDRSTDGGVTWGGDVRVNDVYASGVWSNWILSMPSMAIAPDGTVYLAWTDDRDGNPDAYMSASSDGGLTWTPNVRLNDDAGTGVQFQTELAVDPAGGIHAAWYDGRTGNLNIAYSRSSDAGTTWSANVFVTDAETPITYDRPGDYFAMESGPDGTIYAVWTDGRGSDLDIYFSKLVPTTFVTVEADPTGARMSVDGSLVATPATFFWIPGSNHTLEAPELQDAGPGTRLRFDAWADAAPRTRNLTVSAEDVVAHASFTVEYLLTLESPYGNATGGGWYPAGATASISIEENVTTGGRTVVFVRWEGNATSTSSRTSVLMDEPKTVRAVWTEGAPSPAGLEAWAWASILIVIAGAVLLLVVRLRRRRPRNPQRT